jgi:hypothetical protein
MEHLFVPLPIAEVVAKKGFNEECLALYDRQNESKFELAKNPVTNWFPVFYTPAPTWDQVFSWLREEHKLHFNITTTENLYQFEIEYYGKNHVTVTPGPSAPFDYARHKAIELALNLLP